MTKGKKILLILPLTALVLSCGNNAVEEVQNTGDTSSTLIDTAVTEEHLSADIDGKLLTLPLDINNENYGDLYDPEIHVELMSEQMDSLQLSILEEDFGQYYVLGRFDFLDNITTRLIFRKTEAWSEWTMWLVNYDDQDKLLSRLLILYGDNVESLSETYCILENGSILVTDVIYDYSEDEPVKRTHIQYVIEESGQFFGEDVVFADENEIIYSE